MLGDKCHKPFAYFENIVSVRCKHKIKLTRVSLNFVIKLMLYLRRHILEGKLHTHYMN